MLIKAYFTKRAGINAFLAKNAVIFWGFAFTKSVRQVRQGVQTKIQGSSYCLFVLDSDAERHRRKMLQEKGTECIGSAGNSTDAEAPLYSSGVGFWALIRMCLLKTCEVEEEELLY